MSMYWGATVGYALVLNYEEYCAFLEAYIKARPTTSWIEDYMFNEEIESVSDIDFTDLLDYLDEETEIGCLWSVDIDDQNKRIFDFERVSPLNGCSGIMLYAFDGETYEFDDGTSMVVWGDKSDSVFSNNHYDDRVELIAEMKEKLQRYLPANFDWLKHIGQCCFARNA